MRRRQISGSKFGFTEREQEVESGAFVRTRALDQFERGAEPPDRLLVRERIQRGLAGERSVVCGDRGVGHGPGGDVMVRDLAAVRAEV